MSYIGNTSTTQAFTPAIDYFSGNASTTAFTLSRPVASVAQVQAVIDNVPQNPNSAFTVSGQTITFTSAPLSGTNNIYVYYTSPITQVIAPGQGTAGTTALDVYGGAGTAAMNLPSGTTAQRPGTPANGAIRYNTTTGFSEAYQNGSWSTFVISYAVDYLIVAGGGAGGYDQGGGGGAGGLVSGTTNLTQGSTYTITVGAGATQTGNHATTANGSNSSFNAISTVAVGGGGAAGYQTASASGGSGGGGGGANSTASPNAGGSATSGQGNAGGTAVASSYCAAGGGGASAAGSNSTTSVGGNGGAGTASSITGSSVTYAGGGGGGVYAPAGQTPGSGGAGGGGGGGGTTGTVAGTAGTANTGGGGGGGSGSGGAGGNGGSGVVIISVPTSKYTGTTTGSPTITTSGSNTILKFTASGSYTA